MRTPSSISLLLALAITTSACSSGTSDDARPDGSESAAATTDVASADPSETPSEPVVVEPSDPLPEAFPIVRGVYSTKWSFWGERWERLLGLIETTELNAIVVDVKDDRGEVSWQMDLELAQSPGASDWAASVPTLEDAQAKVKELLDLGGYPIARVVCFKDSPVAKSHPELAVIDTRDGGPWQGRDDQHWLNPYQDEAWQYCIDVGKEAAKAGFLEVQFDYVRFPNGGDGPSKYFSFPGVPAERPEDEWRHPHEIRNFLASAATQLHEAGVRVSADVFGLTTYNYSWNGDGTGQMWEQLVEELDYISPMVYPSHYIAGNYGMQPHPVQFPYELISQSMEEAQLRTVGTDAGIRPWLEDFGSPWLSASGPHTPERLRQQIQGAYDRGIESWLLWNAGNTYSVEALAAVLEPHSKAWVPDPTALGGSGGDVRGAELMQRIMDKGPEIETPSQRRAREEAEAKAAAEKQAAEEEAARKEAADKAAAEREAQEREASEQPSSSESPSTQGAA